MLLIWIYGSVLAPLPPREFLLDVLLQYALITTGIWMGTTEGHVPGYMAPEQFADAHNVTAASDVYALGLLVFEAAAGRPPFQMRNAFEAVAAHSLETPPLLVDLRPGIPRALSDLVARCLEKEPGARPTAVELAKALGSIADDLGAADATELGPPASIVQSVG